MLLANRVGGTFVTSVSISKEFKEILDNYDLSPTDVFRKGMGVTLYEIGEIKYRTSMNRKRLEGAEKILKEINKADILMKKLVFLKESIEKLEVSFNLIKNGGK